MTIEISRMCPAMKAAAFVLFAWAAAATCGSVHAQSPIFSSSEGQPINEGFGWTVAGGGDLDLDGYDDVLVRGAARVWVISGRTGQDMQIIQGTGAFATAIAGGGDSNADGWPDVLIGNHMWDSPPSAGGGAWIYSGKTYTALKAFIGDSANDHFGSAVRWMGDVDSDGRMDILVGSEGDDSTIGSEGSAKVLSSFTKAVLAKAFGTTQTSGGHSVAAPGDMNLDGIPDFAFGGLFGGYCRIVSGTDSTLIREVKVGTPSFGISMDAAGDVDLDGVPDLIVGESAAAGIQPKDWNGAAHLVSGSDGMILFSVAGDKPYDYFGHSVAGLGDVDADGQPDVAVSSFQQAFSPWGTPPTYARVFSGATGEALFTVSSYLPTFGQSIASAGDVNADGTPDLIVGAPKTNGVGAAIVYSGKPLALSSYQHEISAFAGNFQLAYLDAGSTAAGRPYVLLGSATGALPGTMIDSLLLPLNVDSYTLFTLQNPNLPPLTHSFGVFDPSGKARCKIEFASVAGLPPGLVLHHAFVVLGSDSILSVSNPLTLAFDP